ncbi:peroxidase family protein [Altericista sp. CCNU0014]|uniref:peroxidase family protein n=1 Tax=Altericista sp. CCNU0014 TaxID=3082949 RepID=UPI00384C80B4
MATKPWHERPTFLALLALAQFREQLRKNNLHDTSQFADKEKLPHPAPPDGDRHLSARMEDGSYNDLEHPEMGMVGARFGRNAPIEDAFPDSKNLLNPNPREISRRLMTREEFKPATSLNVLAAAWIQFQNHDWFSHGSNNPNKKINIPLKEDDPWPQDRRPMNIDETSPDPSRLEGDASALPTHINEVTHWWDGSQIYGSTFEKVHELRTHKDGKIKIGEDGFLLEDPTHPGIDFTGFNDNWWVGLSLLHTAFAKEHNYLCDELKKRYPDWNDGQLFDKARLINAALTAKIHTVEWTPGILSHPALQIAMAANWWGILGQHVKNLFGRVGGGEALSGIVGSHQDHGAAPYALTEEFVSVYRLHPLIPDDWKFYSIANGKFLAEKNFQEVAGNRTRGLMAEIDINDLWYSLGIAHPGAITLHNYPRFLQTLVRDDGQTLDLAMVDVLRDRERGVPRYNKFRELIGMGRVNSFEEICPKNPVWAKELREVYNNDLEAVDLMVGMYAEDLPQGFGFSDTAFRVFILMASRRLKSDRFFTDDYRKEVYTQFGLDFIDKTTMIDVILRHYPKLKPALFRVPHAFAPWRRVGVSGY